MYELFDHTADLGLRGTAADQPGVFADLAAALLAALVERPEAVRPVSECSFTIAGSDREYLLFDWLRALLQEFEDSRRVFAQFEITVSDDGLHALARGEEFDEDRHGLGREVKAITYHGLRCEPTADGWIGEVIVDI
jgi:SHS2 domain-containing protein